MRDLNFKFLLQFSLHKLGFRVIGTVVPLEILHIKSGKRIDEALQISWILRASLMKWKCHLTYIFLTPAVLSVGYFTSLSTQNMYEWIRIFHFNWAMGTFMDEMGSCSGLFLGYASTAPKSKDGAMCKSNIGSKASITVESLSLSLSLTHSYIALSLLPFKMAFILKGPRMNKKTPIYIFYFFNGWYCIFGEELCT